MFEHLYPRRKRIISESLGIARMLKEEYSVRAAADYMRYHGWSIEAALFWLLRKVQRDHGVNH